MLLAPQIFEEELSYFKCIDICSDKHVVTKSALVTFVSSIGEMELFNVIGREEFDSNRIKKELEHVEATTIADLALDHLNYDFDSYLHEYAKELGKEFTDCVVTCSEEAEFSASDILDTCNMLLSVEVAVKQYFDGVNKELFRLFCDKCRHFDTLLQMQDNLNVLARYVNLNELKNWRKLWKPRVKIDIPWWLDGTLELLCKDAQRKVKKKSE